MKKFQREGKQQSRQESADILQNEKERRQELADILQNG
jgi:hypothetical protein